MPPAIAALGADAEEKFHAQMTQTREWYLEWQSLLGGGEKSNEDARFVLPNAAETKMIVTMNARELRQFFRLRCCNRAQWEIRAVAWLMLEAVVRVAPALFSTAGPACCEQGVCSEGKMSCGRLNEVRAYHAAVTAKK
jgi:thymidylate synthase (FAD)